MENRVQDIQDMEKWVQDMENDAKNRVDEIETRVIAIESGMRIIRSNANPQTRGNDIVKRMGDIEANHILLKTEVDRIDADVRLRVQNLESDMGVTITSGGRRENHVKVRTLENDNKIFELDGSVSRLETDIKSLQKNINTMKEKDSLLIKYNEEKKTLLAARDALIAVRTKMTDRLDALHYGSFTVMALLVAVNAFFYVYIPPPGKTNQLYQLFGRLMVVMLIISVVFSFLGEIWGKVINIVEEINDSDERFEDLGVWFDGLSKTRAQRDAERSLNLQPKLKLFYPNADRYDNLRPEDLIPSGEVKIFKTRGKNQSIGSTVSHLQIMCGVTGVALVSFIMMTLVSVVQSYLHTPPPLPKCG